MEEETDSTSFPSTCLEDGWTCFIINWLYKKAECRKLRKWLDKTGLVRCFKAVYSFHTLFILISIVHYHY